MGLSIQKADVNGVRIAELNERVMGDALEPPSFDGISGAWDGGYGQKAGESGHLYHWEILPDVPWADRMIITMKICCIVFFGVNAELLIDHAWGMGTLYHGGDQGL